jgi:DNA-directed RNA polymerase specialized sigma24 family protein
MSTFFSKSGASPPTRRRRLTRKQFAKLYEAVYEDAIHLVQAKVRGACTGEHGRGVRRDRAEDAVQNAALYVMEHLAEFEYMTASYFKQLCISRGKDMERGNRRQWARAMPSSRLPNGTDPKEGDMTAVEKREALRRTGRVRPEGRGPDKAE